MSIRTKLTIMFLAVALIPTLFVGSLTYTNFKHSIEEHHIEGLQNITFYKAERIETYFYGLKTNIETAQGFYNIKTNLPVLNRFANNPAKQEFLTAKKTLDAQLQHMQRVLGLSDIMLVNPSGKIVYKSNSKNFKNDFLNLLPDPEQKSFEEGSNKVYFSDVFLNKVNDNKLVMLITAPAYDSDGIFIGVIVFEVDMVPIFKIMQDVAGLGVTGEILLGKKVGNQIVYINPLRHDPGSVLNRSVNIGGKLGGPIQEAVQGKKGAGHLIDYRDKEVIAAWQYIPSLDWGIVAKIDAKEAFIDTTNLRNLTIIIMIITLVLCGIMAFSIAHSFSEPIKKLSYGAEIIGSGNLDYEIEINLKDEIGQLSKSLNKMTHDLKNVTASRNELNKEIAERKQVEEKLTTLYSSMTEGVVIHDIVYDESGKAVDYIIKDTNPAFSSITGLAKENAIGKKASELYATNQPPYLDIYSRVASSGNPESFETYFAPMGKHFSISVFSPGKGKFATVFQDITERKQSEKLLQESEEQLERAQKIAHLGSWELDLINNRLIWSDEVYRIFGLKPQEFAATYEAFLEAIHPEDRSIVDNAYSSSIREGRDNYEIEHRVINKSTGETRIVQEKCEHIRDKSGKIIQSIGMIQDITERREAEDSVVRAKEEWERTFNSVPDMIAILDDKHQIIQVNEAMSRRLGLKAEQCIGLPCYKCVHGLSEPPNFCPHSLTLKDGHQHIEEVYENKLGGYFLVSTTPLFDKKGKMIGDVHVARDITELKRAELELKRSNENLEQFAYVASHDLQEPLRMMASYSELLEKRYKDKLDKDANEFIEFIVDGAKRLQKLINDLLAYSRIGRTDKSAGEVDCNTILGKVINSMHAYMEESGAIITNDELPTLIGNESNFVQLFQNLIGNAIKFRKQEPPQVHISAKKENNEWLFSVKDNGIGIEPQYKDRIFLIFQRLHARVEYPGTGIGLSICKKIVETLGGKIWVESEYGKGSTFYFTIPAKS